MDATDPDLLPLSGLQHVVFCPRQCALIHVEGVFTENRFTLEGRHLHERVDDASTRSEEGYRVARALPLVSHRLGVFGVADVVEFHPVAPESPDTSVSDVSTLAVRPEGAAPSAPFADAATMELRPPEPCPPTSGPMSAVGTAGPAVRSDAPSPALEGHAPSWPPKTERPYPVEYKRGRKRHRLADQVQLCAQAMALEEIFSCEIPEGALYYNASKRRQIVPLDAALRATTAQAARDFHRLWNERRTPPPVNDDRCDDCSLRDWCLPGVTAKAADVTRYIRNLYESP